MYAERANRKLIELSFSRPFITAIIGPRRVGKTLFVLHFAEMHPQHIWVFLNLDDIGDRDRIEKQGLENLIQERAKQLIGKQKIWVVIDEAQKSPAVFDSVKLLYDKYKDQDIIKFILTGSAVLSLHQLSAETLAGRIEIFYLREFTLRESALYRDAKVPRISILDLMDGEKHPLEIGEAIHELSPFKPLLDEELHKHLLWGGLPEVLQLDEDNDKITYLNNYIQTYLEKDVRAIETVTNLPLYRHLMGVIAEQTGSLREDKKLVDALGCTRDTLKKYRGYLEATLLYRDIYPFIGSTIRRIVKSPKGYLMNNGLVSVLTGFVQQNLLVTSGLIGHRLENLVFNELSVWLARSPLLSEVYYWRLETGIEVDFVVERKPNIFPFEVTYNTKVETKKLRNLQKFLSEETKAGWGYYIYRGDFTIDHEHRICFIPAWALG